MSDMVLALTGASIGVAAVLVLFVIARFRRAGRDPRRSRLLTLAVGALMVAAAFLVVLLLIYILS